MIIPPPMPSPHECSDDGRPTMPPPPNYEDMVKSTRSVREATVRSKKMRTCAA